MLDGKKGWDGWGLEPMLDGEALMYFAAAA
jgi:hypothetical protein